jgi:CubicO group peptidase (beta-lactamase class C family)
VLRINPRSRIVRWQPGTRMSYSNPGYTVAAYVLEQATGEKYEDVIQKKIFEPIGMKTSSFRLTEADKATLAKGYARRGEGPVPFSQIYLRPSGNLHTSAAELGAFVHVLLNWGELPGKLVVDPEYLSNMEHPRTTLASRAGLRNGYGAAIGSLQIAQFPLLGHGGGIEGFVSQYAYSPSRDIGFVVLLNGTFASRAMDRICELAVQYLKADVEAPAKAELTGQPAFVDRYVGYYHDASPRHQLMGFTSWLLSGQTIAVRDGVLVSRPVFGSAQQLIPVGEGLVRRASDVDATRVFATDGDGLMVLTGVGYAVRLPRWRVEIVRVPVMAAYLILVSPLLACLFWAAHATRAVPRGFWTLKITLLIAAVCPLPLAIAIARLDGGALSQVNLWTGTIYASTVLLPFAGAIALAATIFAWAGGAGRWLRVYALAISCSAIVVSAYLYFWGMLGFKSWNF